jgi:nicotinate phosphoribosyltransferase
VATAVEVAGPDLGAVRIDSGDLALYARQVREQLDSLGATGTRIVLTGDLDEHSIAALAAAPVDGYGVGTSLVTGSGAPTAALVYKMVARAQDDGDGPLRPVAKRSVGKPSRGGRKWAVRQFDARGRATTEHVTDTPPGPDSGRPLLRHLVRDGEIIGREPLDAARDRHRSAVAELPPHALALSRGYPAIPTTFSPDRD